MPDLLQNFLLCFLSCALIGTLVPWMVFLKKDRDAGGYFSLGRLAYIGMLVATLGVLFVVSDVLDRLGKGSVTGIMMGWVIPLAYVSTRRMVDLGWSRSYGLLGLIGFYDRLFPFVLLSYIIFMFVPGVSRAKRPAASLPPQPQPRPDPHPHPHPHPPQSAPPASIPARPKAIGSVTAPPPAPGPQVPAHQRDISLSYDGGTYGPYTTEDIVTLWQSGQLAGNVHYRELPTAPFKPLSRDITALINEVAQGQGTLPPG